MKLKTPFLITPRLAPGLNISGAFLSFDGGIFVLDIPSGINRLAIEHEITDFRFGGRIAGETDCERLQKGFAAILSFLSACAESRAYARRNGKDEMDGGNSGLFPHNVGEWAEENKGEIDCLAFELEEGETLIEE